MSFSIAQFEYDQVMMVAHVLRNQSSNLCLPSPRLVDTSLILCLSVVCIAIGPKALRERGK